MAFNKTDRPDGAKMRRPGGMRRRKKVCVFCGDKNGTIDYLREVKSFLVVSLATAQSIREL